ncbi:fructokinase [Aequitasia blattaphilus]|uniref:Carbohydrate kinase n=1 Tax=Aequitasia blattaphilus TaxID=2949332 RepID=A0ABT1E946_9FIRM|nr:carbohydrate kinase [Aequitasia blattaphilus]MCP1102303.1 carbohydrate kinase [Aequitasia blattaphilus]MCR8614943.1 carbohydrate kinase [Aequitasia blattaphilus]
MRYDVCALGETLIDFTTYGESDQGNTVFEACPGGAPCNVLTMLTKLGRDTAFIGKVGKDQFGKTLIETIKKVGVETKGIVEDEKVNTTLAFVHTFPDGDRDFSFYRNPGADMMLTSEEVDFDLIKDSKVFHFGTLSMTSEPVYGATMEALKVAKENNVLISFDPNLRPPLWDTLERAKEMMELGFAQCDILKISDNEIQFVTGVEDYDEGIRIIREKYNIPLVFLTMGKDGSRAYYKDIRVEMPGYKVETIETTGAGDTFTACGIGGVLEHGIENLNKENLAEIIDFANAAAACTTTRKGAILSMPDIEEVEALRNKSRQ